MPTTDQVRPASTVGSVSTALMSRVAAAGRGPLEDALLICAGAGGAGLQPAAGPGLKEACLARILSVRHVSAALSSGSLDSTWALCLGPF